MLRIFFHDRTPRDLQRDLEAKTHPPPPPLTHQSVFWKHNPPTHPVVESAGAHETSHNLYDCAMNPPRVAFRATAAAAALQWDA